MILEFPKTDLIGCKFPKCNGRNGRIEVLTSDKEYIYRLLPEQPQPKIGDFVVTSCVNGFQVCVVTSLNVPTSTYKDIAYVVGAVDVATYQETLRKAEMKKELHKQLLAKKKELEDLVTFELLAEKSPEFRALLESYQAL